MRTLGRFWIFSVVLLALLGCKLNTDINYDSSVSPGQLPEITLSETQFTESDSDQSKTITINLAEPMKVPVELQVSVENIYTDSSDVTLSETTIQVPAGQTSVTVSFSILGDDDGEGDETFRLVFYEPKSQSQVKHTITIVEDDPIVLSVEPLLANYPNWGEYQAAYPNSQHGGEAKKVVATGQHTCTGLSMEDNLGAFEWTCDDSTDPVQFHSKTLKDGKGLRDLIDVATPGFKNMKVTLSDDNGTVAESNLATWWSNTVEALPDSTSAPQTLVDNGKVYFQDGNVTESLGYVIYGNGISIALMGATTVTASTNIPNNCTVNNNRCLFYINFGTSRTWIEGGTLRGAANTNVLIFASGLLSIGDPVHHHIADMKLENCSPQIFDEGCLTLYYVADSKFKDIEITESDNSGLGLIDRTMSNYFENIHTHSNTGHGINFSSFAGGNVGYGNIFVNTKSMNNGGYGIRNGNNDGNSNVLMNVIAANNGGMGISMGYYNNRVINAVVANNGSNGIHTENSDCLNCRFQNITAINNDGNGVYLEHGGNHSVHGLLAINNSGSGLVVNKSNTSLHNIVATDNSSFAASITGDSDNNTFTGHFYEGNNSDGSCELFTSGSAPGLNTSCQATDASTSVLTSSYSGVSDIVGDVGSDSTNGSPGVDSSGSVSYGSISDWLNFDNFYRAFGQPNTSFPSFNNRGWCDAGNCQVWDWSVPTGSSLLNINGTFNNGDPCPASVHGNIALNSNYGYFLKNAFEVLKDGIGNDDGLCHSGEACIFSPNIGAYQGHGDPTQKSCVFNDDSGTASVTGVTMYAYPNNGR